MITIEKIKEVKRIEYQMKLIALQLKYSRHFDKIWLLVFKLGASINQLRILASQPIPKFKPGSIQSGIASIQNINLPEVIETPNGTKYIVNDNRSRK